MKHVVNFKSLIPYLYTLVQQLSPNYDSKIGKGGELRGSC